ncbi:MAG: tetratricopeptide repeat protein [Bacteroidota bacterium]|nr:tetratricopeptide repeat protein [Bacteroidota bacterium]
MNPWAIRFFFLIIFSCFLLPEVHAQLDKITYDLEKDKPEKFKTKTLKSEKTGEKKFTIPRRFIQNTVSHYNYFFNANNKINTVIERARMSRKDDYSALLPFYSFSLTTTAAQKNELDSVIYKSTAGILLHDLRSDWVDNLYLLIGEAYYLRKDFDSASMTFQFINYNLFPRKRKREDDQLIVGSNDNGNNNALSISSRESQNIVKKVFSRPPSRNDALIWQVRTLIEMGEFSDASGFINTLLNDPFFPKRLRTPLEEMQGYWFFKQQMYDSAVIHMVEALPNAMDEEDKARREYLIAQLYEMNHKQDTASEYYDKVIRHTTNPLMDIYANLNKAKMLKSKDPSEIDKSIGRLLHMAKKDKFDLYRDIIFYSAAQLALEKPDTSAAVSFFKKSVFYNTDNISGKNKAFLILAEISYQQKKYKDAFAFYDSLQTSDTTLGDISKIITRRNALAQIVKNINIIEREDSLQAIAALSPADREAFLKKLSKKLESDRGAKDENGDYSNSAFDYFNTRNQSGDIFANNVTKGDWYFYNTSVKSKGFTEFKRVWGKRQDVDNWRRNSNSNQIINNNTAPGGNPDSAQNNPGLATRDDDPLTAAAGSVNANKTMAAVSQKDISVAGLLANVPLSKPLMDSSNRKIAVSLFQLGKNYQDLLEDYNAAIETYSKSLKRFPDSLYQGELYLNLSYCYRKTGNLAQADYYKNLLLNKFSKSKFTQYALHPESFNPSKKDTASNFRYDDIYNLFIEGNFDKAIKEKQRADSLYGNSYWTPQLLYIQSVYYIRQRQDSMATNVLNQILVQFPHSPMRNKAATMISVLNRRDSIEKYLTNLHVERLKEDSEIVVFDDTKISKNVPLPSNSNNIEKKTAPAIVEKAVINPDKQLPAAIKNKTFTFDPNVSQYVVMVLKKVDPVYSSEARNAFVRYNREKFYSLNLQITKDTLDNDRTLLIFSEFINADAAIKYRDRIKNDARVEISWLPADKYSFYIISNTNLELLKENKNLQSYIDLLNIKYPGKF